MTPQERLKEIKEWEHKFGSLHKPPPEHKRWLIARVEQLEKKLAVAKEALEFINKGCPTSSERCTCRRDTAHYALTKINAGFGVNPPHEKESGE